MPDCILPLGKKRYFLKNHCLIGFCILEKIMDGLPDFLIIGAQKCGTTSLYAYLVSHPKINSASRKELHFFDRHFQKGSAWYRSHFNSGNHLTGEATPYYFFHPLGIRRIYSLLPNVKLILLLRNPVDRAFSHYYHEVLSGLENLSFEEAIKEEPKRLSGEVEKMKEQNGYYSFAYENYSYLERGKYIERIKVLYKTFDPNQIMIIKSEEFFSHPKLITNKVFDFLGLANFDQFSPDVFNHETEGIISSSTRKNLKEFFKPYNEELSSFLKKDFNWDS